MSRRSDPPHASEPPTTGEADRFCAAPVALLEPIGACPSVRERLLEAARPEGRFSRFASKVAELLDVDEASAAAMLDRAGIPSSYEPGPFPGVTLLHVVGGPSVAAAITGFVRIAGGDGFPHHEHLGDETVLVISGSMAEPETGRVHRAGDVVRARTGESHSLIARPGPDLVYLAILFDGLRVGETAIRADDPRL